MDREDLGGGHLEEALRAGARRPVDLVSGDLTSEAFWDLASTFSAAAACSRTAARRSSATPAPAGRRRPSEAVLARSSIPPCEIE